MPHVKFIYWYDKPTVKLMLPCLLQALRDIRSRGTVTLPLTFRSSSGDVSLLRDVAYVSSLSYHLLSLRVAADNGYTYTVNKEGVIVRFNTGETLFLPSVRRG